ncbi:MAG: DNA-binding protein [Methanobacteriota archaeon]
MDDDELQALRRKRIEEIQRNQQDAAAQQKQREAAEAQMQSAMRQILTPEARERLARLKIAYPDVVASVEQQLIGLAQSGRLDRMIDDSTLQQILQKVLPERRDIKIKRM